MKKRIYLLMLLIIIMTGCTCEYNLEIKDGNYQEKIIITGENASETSYLNNKWSIPIDKDEYNLGTDPEFDSSNMSGNVYNYNVSGNNLILTYNFNRSSYQKSSAIFKCLNSLNITDYEGNMIISSSSNFTCFDDYPNLKQITINVKTNMSVTSNNADRINGKIYTWNINTSNYRNKSINLILSRNSDKITTTTNRINPSNNTKKNDYTMYIFALILLAVMIGGYFLFTKIKNNGNNLND